MRGVLLGVRGRVPRMVGRFPVSRGRRLGTVDRPVAVAVAGLRVAVAVLVVAGRGMSILLRC